MSRQWTKEDLLHVFECLIERKVGITTHPAFRNLLNRDQHLFANQITREATNNIAYRSVDFNLDGLSNKDVWQKLDGSEYHELIEDNAAAALMKMAEKLGLVE